MSAPNLSHLKLLITLAMIDGSIAEKERHYIINIGRANGVYPDQIEPLFKAEHPVVVPDDLDSNKKFEYIFSLVQLMKIDERMYKEEILFCSKVASSLGYSQQVMFELLLHVKAGEMEASEIESLKALSQKYLRPTQ